MGDLSSHLTFALKVAVAMLVINQIAPIRDIVNRNYFAS